MTPESQRIAIAEACGWVEMPIGGLWKFKGQEVYAICDTNVHNCTQLPSYLTDLNAMHEAEGVLDHGQRLWFGEALHKVLKLEYELDDDTQLSGWSVFDTAHATAAQRAEAFLKTLNLWMP